MRTYNEFNTGWHGAYREAGFTVLNRDFPNALGHLSFWDNAGRLVVWHCVSEGNSTYYFYDLDTLQLISKKTNKKGEL